MVTESALNGDGDGPALNGDDLVYIGWFIMANAGFIKLGKATV